MKTKNKKLPSYNYLEQYNHLLKKFERVKKKIDYKLYNNEDNLKKLYEQLKIKYSI